MKKVVISLLIIALFLFIILLGIIFASSPEDRRQFFADIEPLITTIIIVISVTLLPLFLAEPYLLPLMLMPKQQAYAEIVKITGDTPRFRATFEFQDGAIKVFRVGTDFKSSEGLVGIITFSEMKKADHFKKRMLHHFQITNDLSKF